MFIKVKIYYCKKNKSYYFLNIIKTNLVTYTEWLMPKHVTHKKGFSL